MICSFCCIPLKRLRSDELFRKTFKSFCSVVLNIDQDRRGFFYDDFIVCGECHVLCKKAIDCEKEVVAVERRLEQLPHASIAELGTLRRYMDWLRLDVKMIADTMDSSKVPAKGNHFIPMLKRDVFKALNNLTTYKEEISKGLLTLSVNTEIVKMETPIEEPQSNNGPKFKEFANCRECRNNFDAGNFEDRLKRNVNKMCKRNHQLVCWLRSAKTSA